jgi:galactitol-specific phosphotransferase system IIC component
MGLYTNPPGYKLVYTKLYKPCKYGSMEDRTIVNGCVYIYINLYLGGLVILYYSGLFYGYGYQAGHGTWGFQSLSSMETPIRIHLYWGQMSRAHK